MVHLCKRRFERVRVYLAVVRAAEPVAPRLRQRAARERRVERPAQPAQQPLCGGRPVPHELVERAASRVRLLKQTPPPAAGDPRSCHDGVLLGGALVAHAH
eukprot:2137860-Prymnesium_polylepis.1